MKFRSALIAALCVSQVSILAYAEDWPPIKVPADPYARYKVIDVKQRPDGMYEITTERRGKSGTSYSKRLVDCINKQAKYLGDGDTLKEMEASKESPRMGPLISGSSTHTAAMYACKYGRKLRK